MSIVPQNIDLGLAEVAKRIASIKGHPPKRTAKGYTCRCPLQEHEDQTPSFAIFRKENGWIGLKCHGNCTGCQADYLSAAGLTNDDLRPADAPANTYRKTASSGRTASAAEALSFFFSQFSEAACNQYEYPEADGSVGFVVMRWDFDGDRRKEIRQAHRLKDGSWIAKAPGTCQ